MDAVINHMCGEGAQAGTSSTCGSYFNPQSRDFSGVPYSGWDFNDGKCRTGSGGIENYNDAAQVRKMISIKKFSPQYAHRTFGILFEM